MDETYMREMTVEEQPDVGGGDRYPSASLSLEGLLRGRGLL